MKILLIVLALAGLGYYYYTYQTNPAEISDPIYAEARVELQVHDRELTMVLVGEMVDDRDCEQRGEEFWRQMLEDCHSCEFIDYQCRQALSRRYQDLFENRPTFTTYVVADRGNRFERNARMIVWGLSRQEASELCNYLITSLEKKYHGEVSCIEGLSG